MKRFAPRRLERFRAKKNKMKVAEPSGRGKALAREAKVVNIKAELKLQKATGKAVKELAGLDVAALQEQLVEARKELFDLRFKHVSGQLLNVASLGITKRRIARILTLIGQKEVGA